MLAVWRFLSFKINFFKHKFIQMKTIKNLRVTVKYTVGYGTVEVPDNVYEQLMDNQEIDNINDETQSDAMEWLGENMKEQDAMDWSYEIDDIEEA